MRQAGYALPIELVREIIEYAEITRVPMMPAYIHGVLNLRGNVVPVLDLAARFGMDLTVAGKRTCIVIIALPLEGGVQRIGLVVDAVDAVLDTLGDESRLPLGRKGQVFVFSHCVGSAALVGRRLQAPVATAKVAG